MIVMSRVRIVLVLAAVVLATTSGCETPRATEQDRPAPSAAGEATLAARLAVGSTRHVGVSAANTKLNFRAQAPNRAVGRTLIAAYARADIDDVVGGEDLGGKANVIQVLYEGDLLITEKRWNTAVIQTQEQYGLGLTESPRAGEYLHSKQYDDVTVWYHDPVALVETTSTGGVMLPGVYIGVAAAQWFVDGVSYIISAPDATAQDLLGVAETMLP